MSSSLLSIRLPNLLSASYASSYWLHVPLIRTLLLVFNCWLDLSSLMGTGIGCQQKNVLSWSLVRINVLQPSCQGTSPLGKSAFKGETKRPEPYTTQSSHQVVPGHISSWRDAHKSSLFHCFHFTTRFFSH